MVTPFRVCQFILGGGHTLTTIVRRGRRTSTACNETLTIVVTPTPSTYPVISTSTAGGTNNSSASYLSGAPVTANGYSVPYTNQTA